MCGEATLSLAPFLSKCGGFSPREASSGKQRKRGIDYYSFRVGKKILISLQTFQSVHTGPEQKAGVRIDAI